MIGIITYGKNYIGSHTSGNRELSYCQQCRQERYFLEMEGKKYFCIQSIPVYPIGDKLKWWECGSCELKISDIFSKMNSKYLPTGEELIK